MKATYDVQQRKLGIDDERGVTYLYHGHDPNEMHLPDPNSVGSISGVVTDASTNNPDEPIEGATVSIADFPISATTESNGSYSLTDVPKIGTYSVTASAKGYVSSTPVSVSVGSIVHFDLEPDSDSDELLSKVVFRRMIQAAA